LILRVAGQGRGIDRERYLESVLRALSGWACRGDANRRPVVPAWAIASCMVRVIIEAYRYPGAVRAKMNIPAK